MTNLEKRAAARRAMLEKDNLTKRAEARRALLAPSLEQRAAARHAMLEDVTNQTLEGRANARRAYMQSGPGPNDPKNLGFPGELKYPRMEVPVGGDSRQWEQNWFEGAAEVSKQKHGPAGVELELKKKMQRASLELRGLEKKAKNESEARVMAAKIANDLNEIVTGLDKAGFVAEAHEADEILKEVAEFVASPVEAKTNTESLSVKAELINLANSLDGKGYTEEADEIDKIVAEL